MSRGRGGERGQHFQEFQESEKEENPCPSKSSLMYPPSPHATQDAPKPFRNGRDLKTLPWLTTLSPSGFRGEKRFPGCPSRPTLSRKSYGDTWHTRTLLPEVWRSAVGLHSSLKQWSRLSSFPPAHYVRLFVRKKLVSFRQD
jgi:hypothetical protein